MNVEKIMADLEAKHPGESEYLQAVREVLESIVDVYNQHPEFEKAKIVERMVEPERIFTFRVTWIDDKGEVQTNLGYRVQFNSAIGPYKGGLRFHKAVTPSMLKFLGFEQTFKNALTTLPMGGGKGGSDFDPVGKSDAEIMRFCQAFMLELRHNIGPDQDVPAGDVGVGGREIGYLNGMYQKLARRYHTGVLTGKGETWGGSILRPEATGYGALYFTQHLLHKAGKDIKGMKVALSGFGNVAWGASKKAVELGAKVVAISGPDGVCEIPEGITPEMIDYMLEMRASNRNKVEDMATKFPGKAKFTAGKKAWSIPCDIALPCAFQNELSEDDAKELKANGCWCCCEVSNMGCQPGAIHFFQKNGVLFAPGKAVNAGGVATSGLEMTQNAAHLSWSAKEVDENTILLEVVDSTRLATHVRNLAAAPATVSFKFLSVVLAKLVLECARKSDVARNAPSLLASSELSSSWELVGHILNLVAVRSTHVEHVVDHLGSDTLGDLANAVGARDGNNLSAELDSLGSGTPSYVTEARESKLLALDVLSSGAENVLSEIESAKTSSLGTEDRATPSHTLAGENASVILTSQLLIHTIEEANLTATNTNVTSRNILIWTNIVTKLKHESLAETHNLSVALANGIEVRATLATAHRQSSKSVLESLLETEELQH